MRETLRLTRREFLGAASCGLGAALAACTDAAPPVDPGAAARLTARPGIPTRTTPAGFVELGLANPFSGRNGLLYVPSAVAAAQQTAAPLLVLLHGAAQSASAWENGTVQALADGIGAVVLAPDSRAFTWDLIDVEEYGDDVDFIDRALAWTFERCRIDPQRVAIGGFSDGASEALSLGLANGDLFDAAIGFSPGFVDDRYFRGKPRVFISHGDNDPVLSFAQSRDAIVPSLQEAGYEVEWVPFTGGHTIPALIGERAFDWLSEWGS